MEWSLRQLKCSQLDRKLRSIRNFIMPQEGWIKCLRKALGMSEKQLSMRLGLSQQRISRIEKDEINKKITLETLEKVAEKLDCKLIYALVPKNSLLETIETTAMKCASKQLTNVGHSMALENQRPHSSSENEQLMLLKKNILEKHISRIWD